MAKSKWHQVRTKLVLIEEWSKSGLTEQQIAHNLGIGRSTLGEYKRQYPELLEALRRGREAIITEIENSLVKRALGFSYQETKVSIRQINGKEVRFTEKSTKYQVPDVGACIILLKNKDRQNWSDNPAKIDLEREIFLFRKQLELARLYGDEEQ
ncbi:MAG: hypothetical protein P4L49_16590 [Desulfosporosinus sp.]|nr:hypothetical protein [Desulfosporosinus sp.]